MILVLRTARLWLFCGFFLLYSHAAGRVLYFCQTLTLQKSNNITLVLECDPAKCASMEQIPNCREDQTLIATRVESTCCLSYICGMLSSLAYLEWAC